MFLILQKNLKGLVELPNLIPSLPPPPEDLKGGHFWRYGGFPTMGVPGVPPIAGWFIMENPGING